MDTEANSGISTRSISSSVYKDLVHYFKYASSAYTIMCPRPNGNTLVMHFSNAVTDIQGFVARDMYRKEIVVAIRGSASMVDVMMDSQIMLVPFVSPDVTVPHGTRVHSGFLVAWNSILLQVIAIVTEQIMKHPDFSIVTTGHSMGGSVALIGAICLRQEFPDSEHRTYSYGSPRTGNKVFADFVNEQFGMNAYRTVHSNDGVPTMIPTSLGYRHHGVEYWQYADPPSNQTTIQCSCDGEDASCSASLPSKGVNRAHTNYFGILVTTPFCF